MTVLPNLNVSKKDFHVVVFEAMIVGAILTTIFYFGTFYVFKRASDSPGFSFMVVFMSGFLFHLIFEYTGLNIWYVQDYSKLLK
jgi:hypothetical protein